MMKTNCPYCGADIEADIEVAVGQHVVCPWCERKFSYGEPRKSPARIEVPKINDGDEVMPAIRQVKFGTCPSLGSLLCRFLSVFRLMFRDRYVIRCSRCSTIDVVYVSKQDGKVTVSCDCGYQFDVGEGRVNYLSWLGEIVGKIRRKQEIDQEHWRIVEEKLGQRQAIDQENEKRKRLREEFAKQLKIFEDDWQAYSDPKAEAQIARVKELTDRFYKKLSVANVNKLYHAQHTNTRLMSMYASNDSVVSIISGVAAWMSSSKDEACEYNAKDLQKMIERNEQAVDYFYALGEEFAGKDVDEARDSRLMSRVGYAHESDLPADEPIEIVDEPNIDAGENVETEEKTVKEIDGFVCEKVGRYGRVMSLTIIIPLAICGAVLFLMTQDHFSVNEALVVFGFAFFIGLVIFLLWPASSYEAVSEDFDSVRAKSKEYDHE